MSLERAKALSRLLREARIIVEMRLVTCEFHDAVKELSHLEIEGDVEQYTFMGDVERRTTLQEDDDLIKAALLHDQTVAELARLQKLYSTRMEVTQDAVAAWKAQCEAAHSRAFDLDVLLHRERAEHSEKLLELDDLARERGLRILELDSFLIEQDQEIDCLQQENQELRCVINDLDDVDKET